jgi:hypothetical protein
MRVCALWRVYGWPGYEHCVHAWSHYASRWDCAVISAVSVVIQYSAVIVISSVEYVTVTIC